MTKILFATDALKESIQLREEICDLLNEKGIDFQIDKYRMTLKAGDVLMVFASATSNHSELYQRHPFDYYILIGEAKWDFDFSGWRKKCISRTKHGSKQIRGEEELLKIVTG